MAFCKGLAIAGTPNQGHTVGVVEMTIDDHTIDKGEYSVVAREILSQSHIHFFCLTSPHEECNRISTDNMTT